MLSDNESWHSIIVIALLLSHGSFHYTRGSFRRSNARRSCSCSSGFIRWNLNTLPSPISSLTSWVYFLCGKDWQEDTYTCLQHGSNSSIKRSIKPKEMTQKQRRNQKSQNQSFSRPVTQTFLESDTSQAAPRGPTNPVVDPSWSKASMVLDHHLIFLIHIHIPRSPRARRIVACASEVSHTYVFVAMLLIGIFLMLQSQQGVHCHSM